MSTSQLCRHGWPLHEKCPNCRPYVLMVAQSVRGRFSSRFHAENELNRLENLARKRGNSIRGVARIIIDDPEERARVAESIEDDRDEFRATSGM